MKRFVPLLILFFVLAGCSTKESKPADSLNQVSKEPGTEKPGMDKRKLIKDAGLRFRTNSNEETYHIISGSLTKFGASISTENTFDYGTQKGYELTIRVPAIQFDSPLSFILGNAQVKELENESTQTQDVTEEFIDLEARIKIKKDAEQRLSELMKQAKNVTEVLEIQKQLTELRADIESAEGRLKYLTNQVDYSTIRVSFYEKVRYANHFFTDFGNALKEGWQIFLHVLTLIAYLWVLILAFFLVRFGYKFYQRKYKNSNADKDHKPYGN